MKIDIKATNMDLTPALTQFVEEKVGVLDKFVPGKVSGNPQKQGEHYLIEAFVEVAKISKHHKHGEVFYAEINLKIGSEVFRSTVKDFDLHAALGSAIDQLKIQLEKEKGMTQSKFKRGARILKRLRSLSPFAWFRKDRN